MSTSDSVIVGPLAQELMAKPPEEQLVMLIDYLGTESATKVALATRVLKGGGHPIVSTLINAAFTRGRRPKHSVRLLEIVGSIDGPVNFDDWMLISAARALPNKSIRDICTHLFLHLGHAGKPLP